jgi:glycerol-3-phosphate dehydrogenase
MVARRLGHTDGKSFGPCSTHRITLSGGDTGGFDNDAFVSQNTELGVQHGLDETEAARLARLYGSNAAQVFAFLNALSGENLKSGLPAGLLAQVRYGLEAEMVTSPADFFIRRTGALYFNIRWVRQYWEPVWRYMQTYFGWSYEEAQSYHREMLTELEATSSLALQPD